MPVEKIEAYQEEMVMCCKISGPSKKKRPRYHRKYHPRMDGGHDKEWPKRDVGLHKGGPKGDEGKVQSEASLC
jgi:hypothetical protein